MELLEPETARRGVKIRSQSDKDPLTSTLEADERITSKFRTKIASYSDRVANMKIESNMLRQTGVRSSFDDISKTILGSLLADPDKELDGDYE